MCLPVPIVFVSVDNLRDLFNSSQTLMVHSGYVLGEEYFIQMQKLFISYLGDM